MLTSDVTPVVPAGGVTCEQVAGRLDDYLTGSMTERERAGVDQHLAACAGCRAAAEEYFEVIRLAGSLPPIHPSPEAEARIIGLLTRALGSRGPDEE